MRLSSELTFGLEIADWQERISVEKLRAERMERARRIMRQHGIPALLAAGPENTRYLTGLRGAEFVPQLWYVLFFVEDDPVVFAHAGFYHNLPAEAPWIQHWRIARSWLGGIPGHEATQVEARKFADEIHEELRRRGLVGEKLALVGFDGVAMAALQECGLRLEPGSALMHKIRKVKTSEEIKCLKVAATLADVAWYEVRETLKPGVREGAVARAAALAALEAGAEQVPPMNMRSGPTTFDRGIDRTNRIIQHGDLVYGAFCGITYLGYRTCSYRTFIVGRQPNAKERSWYARLVDRLNAVIEATRVGATTADAAAHFPPASEWGYKDEAEVLTMEIGHGIGLAQYEPPIINRQWSLTYPQPFEAGMVIAVEGREGEPGVGGVRLEDMVLVTEHGPELIDHFPRDEITPVGF